MIVWYKNLPKTDEARLTFNVADWVIVNDIIDEWFEIWLHTPDPKE